MKKSAGLPLHLKQSACWIDFWWTSKAFREAQILCTQADFFFLPRSVFLTGNTQRDPVRQPQNAKVIGKHSATNKILLKGIKFKKERLENDFYICTARRNKLLKHSHVGKNVTPQIRHLYRTTQTGCWHSKCAFACICFCGIVSWQKVRAVARVDARQAVKLCLCGVKVRAVRWL